MLMSLVLVAVGCAPEEGPVSESVFKGGSQGLVASFEPFGIQEDGVYTIFDTETFPIEVVLKNKGEENVDIGEATVTIKGVNIADFENIQSAQLSNSRAIEEVSDFVPEGGEEIIDFTPGAQDARYKFPVTGFYRPDIFAVAEYDYKTRLIIPQVCFKEDLRDPSVCTVQESKQFFVSGAPITVTSVEEGVAGRGVMVFFIIVNNVGGGKVTKVGEGFDPRFGQIEFELGTEPAKWECRSGGREGEARLVDGKATITCKLREPLEAGTLFTKQVEMTLKYKYQIVIQESLRIRESIS